MSFVRVGGPTTYVTASAATDLWTVPIAHGLVAGTEIIFIDVNDGTGGNLPNPILNATSYYVAASGLTTTQFKTAYTAGGAPIDLLTNSGGGVGGAGIWLLYNAGGGGGGGGTNYVPNYLVVPCATGAGILINIIDAATRGRHYIPQPFLTYLSQVLITENTLPDGFVSLVYEYEQLFTGTATVSVVAGSLPPGVTLSQTSSSWTLSGTPTTEGTYTFTIRLLVGTTPYDYIYHLTINPAPEGGGGAFIGGL